MRRENAFSLAAEAGWDVLPLITIGEQGQADAGATEQALGYRPPGVLDGIAAFPVDVQTLRVLVTHELKSTSGYPYRLDNGTRLTGARISYFDIDLASRTVKSAGLAYRRAFDRSGREVSAAAQINEGVDGGGFTGLCSAHGVRAASSDFVDDLYLTGEEVHEFGERARDGYGGQATVVDVNRQTAYVAPMLGRAAFENLVTVPTGSRDKVALLIGDDRQGGPLYLYLGQKGAQPPAAYQPPELLTRNGFGLGHLYVWSPTVASEPRTSFMAPEGGCKGILCASNISTRRSRTFRITTPWVLPPWQCRLCAPRRSALSCSRGPRILPSIPPTAPKPSSPLPAAAACSRPTLGARCTG